MAKEKSTDPHVLKGQYLHGRGQFEAYIENAQRQRVPIAYRTGVRMSDGGSVPITVKADRLIELIQPLLCYLNVFEQPTTNTGDHVGAEVISACCLWRGFRGLQAINFL